MLTKRQKQVLDFIQEHIAEQGYAPSYEEIADHFQLSSVATVHEHIHNLIRKGHLKKAWNRKRALEPVETGALLTRTVEVPLLGLISAGQPIEAVEAPEQIQLPEAMLGRRPTFVLRVTGESMIEENIQDGDYVIVEDRPEARNGEIVVALLADGEALLKKFYREKSRVRLQPANARLQPLIVKADQVTIRGVVIGLLRKYSA